MEKKTIHLLPVCILGSVLTPDTIVLLPVFYKTNDIDWDIDPYYHGIF